MSMSWLKLYTESRNDAKLRSLSADEFRVWFNLLCFSGEQAERGVIDLPLDLLAIEVSGADTELLAATIKRLIALRILAQEDKSLTFINFIKRQQRKPSDEPEATRERQKKARKKRHNERDSDSVTPCHAMSRDCHATDIDTDTDTDTEKDYSNRFENQHRNQIITCILRAKPLKPLESQPGSHHVTWTLKSR